MPLREYQCDACGHRFEVIQKMSDPPLDTCPKCGEVLRKLQAAPAFHLKGTGWYATDYAKKDQSSAKSEDESKGAKSSNAKDKDKGDKAETKTDSAKSSDSSETSSSSSSSAPSTPSPAPAKTPAKES
ncbi:MAG: FmdB family zinc ribbon protein [Acidobacteriota bacterium]